MHRFAYEIALQTLLSRPPKRLREALSRKPNQILFICKGNICRSAYAEARTRDLLAKRNISDISIRSAGLDTTPGKPAHETTIRIASERELDLTDHRTQSTTQELLNSSDIILAMEIRHLFQLKNLSPTAMEKSYLLGSLCAPSPSLTITDPYGLGDEKFRMEFDKIDSAICSLVDRLL